MKSGARRCLFNRHLEGFLRCSQAAGGSLPPLILFPSSCLLSFPPLSFLLSLSAPALSNISSYVSDTFAKISWTARGEQRDSQLYVAFRNNRKLLSLFQVVKPGISCKAVCVHSYTLTWQHAILSSLKGCTSANADSLRCAGDGAWRISEPVNASQSFHVVDGLEPGTAYTLRLVVKSLLDNASVFEEVIHTQAKGEMGRRRHRSR